MTLGPLMIDLTGTALTGEERALLVHPLVGGVILFSRNYAEPAQLAALSAAIHAARSPPLLVAVDHEGGRVQRFREGFSALPAARSLGRQFDLEARRGLALAREMGWLMAAELLACGVDLSFAPCVDIDYGVSFITDRAFHSRPQAVSQLAAAYAQGMREAGMAATAKHFPGHGAVTADSHAALPVDRREFADLEADLMPYRRLIVNGLPAVMVGHLLFPAVDAAPASFSHRWIGQVLRGELGFPGAVFADDLSMGGAAAYGEIVTRAERALAAGCDMLPVCNDRAAVETLLDHLKVTPAPASGVRLARLHGRQRQGPQALRASARWRDAQALLAQCAAVPRLDLDAGND
ncbi:MAG: beta-N-acetylhexosaminidase [Steroidobacteraceae bacterium]